MKLGMPVDQRWERISYKSDKPDGRGRCGLHGMRNLTREHLPGGLA